MGFLISKSFLSSSPSSPFPALSSIYIPIFLVFFLVNFPAFLGPGLSQPPSMASPPKGGFLFISIIFLSSFVSFSSAHFSYPFFIPRPWWSQNPPYDQPQEPEPEPKPKPIQELKFPNIRIKQAYSVLKAWKDSIDDDPHNMMANWEGPDVCSYTGVYCETSLDGSKLSVVAGVDLNLGDISGQIPDQIGLLTDISLLHISSNRFRGKIPNSISKLKLLHELDLSNNQLSGPFPEIVLNLPNLKYLDLRYNNFQGPLPPQLFEKNLDALFINNNRFTSDIPDTLGKCPASVVVFSNNNFNGPIPKSIGQMANLNEIIFSDNQMSGCLPEEIGKLRNLTVVDMSNNGLTGDLPGLCQMNNAEVFDFSGNKLTGVVPDNICTLPKLTDLNFVDNYFNEVGKVCMDPASDIDLNVADNCLSDNHNRDQKPKNECDAVLSKSVNCRRNHANEKKPPSPTPKPKPKPIHPSPTPTPKSQEPPPPPPDTQIPVKVGGMYSSPPPPAIIGYN